MADAMSISQSANANINHGAFSFSELAEEITDSFQQAIFFVEQAVARLFAVAVEYARFGVNPRSSDLSAKVARRDSNFRIVAYAFHFARICERVNVKHAVIFGEPYRRSDGRSVFSEAFNAQIFLIRELG